MTIPPPNAAGSTRTGVAQCFTDERRFASGFTAESAPTRHLILDGVISGTPCINVGEFEDGKVKPKQSKDSGFTYRFNGTWKPQEDLMFYATWSKGFRPGGINRQPGLAPYDPDFLVNYELGWKTSFGPLRWNGAIYHQMWEKFQFSFLGENSLTVVQNGRDAKINGIETDVNYVHGGLTLNAAAAYTDAKTKENICAVAADTTPNCDLLLDDNGTADPDDDTIRRNHSAQGNAPAGHSEVQDHGNGALRLGCRTGQGARPDRDRPPGVRALRLLKTADQAPDGHAARLHSGRSLRRLRLAEVQRRAVRDERLRQAQRIVARRLVQHLYQHPHRARPSADDWLEGGNEVLTRSA